MIKNKKVVNAFNAAVAMRNQLKQEYLQSIHQSHDKLFVTKAERSIVRGTYELIEGLSATQEQLLVDHEELVKLINKIAKYL